MRLFSALFPNTLFVASIAIMQIKRHLSARGGASWAPMRHDKASDRQAQVRRLIKAARAEGLRIAGMRSDGTLIFYDDDTNPLAPLDEQASPRSKWEDIEA
jgi:hypothetical protein